MPNTIDAIEKSDVVKNIEIYSRGTSPSKPIKIYDNADMKNSRFPNGKYAILGGREEDKEKALQYFKSDFKSVKKLLESKQMKQEEKDIMNKIQQLCCEYRNDKSSKER